MKIIIPMSGYGSRFQEAGYPSIKPLIEVEGKPIIEYVIDLFPGETDFLFICQQTHLEETNLREVLETKVPSCEILAIESHKKGPVWAIKQAFDLIPDNEPCIVNYCDFFMDWDYNHFKNQVLTSGVAGAIPCYIGFHPHLLHEKNVYASCKSDAEGYLEEIREKFSFEADKERAAHSAGTYYFQSGAILKKYSDALLIKGPDLGGEYYVSLIYNHLIDAGLKVKVYDRIAHFCQWGTPSDLEEYNYWSGAFTALAQRGIKPNKR
ncbi:MAG: capsular biosynthesis protein [Proteobacteria bacterium]|nr:capsular biosynthesis protein [Pseudomonadota bacterium]